MVAVQMAQQDQVDRAQPRVVAASQVVGRVVEEANAGRIFEMVARLFAQSSPGCEPTGVIFTF